MAFYPIIGVNPQAGVNNNPIAYPAGLMPGFNVGHFASSNPRASFVISSGPSVVNLLTGTQSTRSGSPTYVIDGVIGPSYKGASAAYLSIASQMPTAAQTSATFAAIILAPTSGSIQQIIGNDNGGGGFSFRLSSTNVIRATYTSVNNFDSSITLTAGRAYFIALTVSNAKTAYFVARDLATGVISQSSVSTSSTATASINGSVFIGNNSGNINPFTGNIAAGMWSGVYLSPQDLLRFASDPWSFWYPQLTNFDVGVAAVVSGNAPPGLFLRRPLFW